MQLRDNENDLRQATMSTSITSASEMMPSEAHGALMGIVYGPKIAVTEASSNDVVGCVMCVRRHHHGIILSCCSKPRQVTKKYVLVQRNRTRHIE